MGNAIELWTYFIRSSQIGPDIRQRWLAFRLTALGVDVVIGSGGDEGTRTPDPRDANAVLSQLSYIPTADRVARRRAAAGPTGSEV